MQSEQEEKEKELAKQIKELKVHNSEFIGTELEAANWVSLRKTLAPGVERPKPLSKGIIFKIRKNHPPVIISIPPLIKISKSKWNLSMMLIILTLRLNYLIKILINPKSKFLLFRKNV